MKKFLCLLLVLMMSCTLLACENKAAMAVDEQILALGEITLDSGPALTAAEEAFNALTGKDKADVLNAELLRIYRTQYQKLILKQRAEEIEKLIHDLRPITIRSDEALADAENKYNEADIDVKLSVENFPDLVSAFQLYRFMKIDLVEKKITAIGDVTLESGPDIEEAIAAYDELSEEDQVWVYNAYILKECIHQYEALQETAETAETTETAA